MGKRRRIRKRRQVNKSKNTALAGCASLSEGVQDLRSYSVLARGVGREDGRARAAMTPEGEDEPAKNAAGDLMKGLTNILSIGSLFPEEVRPEDLGFGRG